MKDFLAKYCTNRVIPSVSTLRNQISDQAKITIDRIREEIGDSDVYFQIDETDDKKSRNVINVIVGKLNDAPSKPMLLDVVFKNVTNANTIQNLVLDSCKLLWPEDVRFKKLVLLLSDQAAYMLKAGRDLKEMKMIFPRLNHITCINHAISLACHSISKEYFLVNKFFTYQKTWFKNSNKRKNSYKAETKLPFIPSPIQIRWGSWLKCANYHRANFDKIKAHFLNIKLSNEPAVLKRIKQMLNGTKLASKIIEVTDKYGKIPSLITMLEAENLKKDQQLNILQSVKEMLKPEDGNEGFSHYQILMSSLSKNPDLETFTSDNNSFSDRVKRSYAPLTFCAVERSFSIYRSVFRDDRTNLKPVNLRNMMIIKYNKFLS